MTTPHLHGRPEDPRERNSSDTSRPVDFPGEKRTLSKMVESDRTVLLREQHQATIDRMPREQSAMLHSANNDLLFLARREADGSYGVTLTEEGVERFETSLAIAGDLGAKTRISSDSSLADVMERTATREELSWLMRSGGAGLLYRSHLRVLRRRLRGSEKPSARSATIGHIAKVAIVCLVALGALLQFVMAIQDIEAIPGILSNLPGDLVNLQPTAAFDQVGNKISDAGQRVLFGVLVACLAFVTGALIHPFRRIYRKDQLLPGERAFLRMVNAALRKVEERAARRSN